MQEQACLQGCSVRHTPAPGLCVPAQLPELPLPAAQPVGCQPQTVATAAAGSKLGSLPPPAGRRCAGQCVALARAFGVLHAFFQQLQTGLEAGA